MENALVGEKYEDQDKEQTLLNKEGQYVKFMCEESYYQWILVVVQWILVAVS